MHYVRVAAAAEVPPGSMRPVRAGDRWYVLANVEGEFYAVDNNCPHNGGSLAKGRLLGREIECPLHQWRWDLKTGRGTWPETQWRVARVPVRREGDDLLLPVL